MENCLFCKIIAGDIPSTKVYEDDKTYAFRDINPMAPVHVLVVPKTHVASLDAVDALSDELLAACLRTCRTVAHQEGIAESGFRVVSNCGCDACQSVQHLHFHVLGGKKIAGVMTEILPKSKKAANFHLPKFAAFLILFPDKNAPRCAANFSFWLT